MAAPVTAQATGTEVVTVACKLPHGLICRLHRKSERPVEVLGGGIRMVVEWEATGDEFTINGNAHPYNEAPKVPLSHGFALTHGVRKDFWDAWLEQNKRHPAVLNGLIFAHERESKTIDEAREKTKQRTGLERIDPNNMPAEFNRVKTADEQKAKPQIAA